MSNMFEYKNKIIFHPGYYLKEYIDELKITEEEFAIRLDMTFKELNQIINGEQNITKEIAIKLSKKMNTSVKYWLNLQSEYDFFYNKINEKYL